jgi:hypothetical protein
MPRLEDLLSGVKWHGSNALELTYKDGEGRPDVTLLYRDHEPSLDPAGG